MNTQTLGLIALLAAPALLLAHFREAHLLALNPQAYVNADPLHARLNLLFGVGWWCALFGLWRVGATGRGPLGRSVGFVPLVTVALATAQPLLDLLGFSPDHPLYAAANLGWPFSMAWMGVVGAAAALAGVLPGRWRYVPLLAGLAAPVWAAVGALAGQFLVLPGNLHVALAWGLIGYLLTRLPAEPRLFPR